jgi:uncharacterized Zn finger protein (UPF0148 family)
MTDLKCLDCDVPLVEPPSINSGWYDGYPYCPKCGTEYEFQFTKIVEVTLPGPARKTFVGRPAPGGE